MLAAIGSSRSLPFSAGFVPANLMAGKGPFAIMLWDQECVVVGSFRWA